MEPVKKWNLERALVVLWLLAGALTLTGLGQLPLRDWDEGIVARVALEASQRPWPDALFPFYWGDPYLNKPPGLHLLIAAAIRLWRAISGSSLDTLPPEWVLRLVPGLLSSTVVPLVGLVQARLRPQQPAVALASAAMALTLLPLARHGRLVMLDGCQLAAILLIWWAVLTPDHRKGPLWLSGGVMGLGASALLLLKAPLAVPMVGATLALRAFDRELSRKEWCWLLGGLTIGCLPGLAWHGAHAWLRGADALQMWGSQGFARVHQQVEGNGGGPLVPLTEMLEGGWPWLTLWPSGLGLAWRQRSTRAGRWCLGTTAITAALVLPLGTQLPWYSLLLWPPVVLCCGPVLVWLVDRQPALKPPGAAITRKVPAFWVLLGALLSAGAVGMLATGQPSALQPLGAVAGAGGFGLLVGGGLLLARHQQGRTAGVLVLVAGLWGALLMLMAGPLWLWELNERWAVGPVVQAMGRSFPPASIHLWELEERPSLNWYAGRRVSPIRKKELQKLEPRPTLLISASPDTPNLQRGWVCQGLPITTFSPKALGPKVHLFRCRPEL